MLLEHRSADTVVVVGRDVGRAEESLTVTTLAELDADIDRHEVPADRRRVEHPRQPDRRGVDAALGRLTVEVATARSSVSGHPRRPCTS